ncbi:hypothetical protein QL285_046188 [Trifolium repens]|nr:hypothetical protein QL285_046188 [Trifolium repens]
MPNTQTRITENNQQTCYNSVKDRNKVMPLPQQASVTLISRKSTTHATENKCSVTSIKYSSFILSKRNLLSKVSGGFRYFLTLSPSDSKFFPIR